MISSPQNFLSKTQKPKFQKTAKATISFFNENQSIISLILPPPQPATKKPKTKVYIFTKNKNFKKALKSKVDFGRKEKFLKKAKIIKYHHRNSVKNLVFNLIWPFFCSIFYPKKLSRKTSKSNSRFSYDLKVYEIVENHFFFFRAKQLFQKDAKIESAFLEFCRLLKTSLQSRNNNFDFTPKSLFQNQAKINFHFC